MVRDGVSMAQAHEREIPPPGLREETLIRRITFHHPNYYPNYRSIQITGGIAELYDWVDRYSPSVYHLRRSCELCRLD